MRKVALYSTLLFIGLGLSQVAPAMFGDSYDAIAVTFRVLTMVGLAFIMIRVGFEFHVDKSQLSSYGWDYVVAFTAASIPWILVSFYFIFVMLPSQNWGGIETWKEVLLAGRFAAPTSAGVLFSMLAAAGLGATWLFHKARILAIFDDLDTVLLMIPLKMLMIGVVWQLGIVAGMFTGLLAIAIIYLHRFRIPVTWPWVVGFSILIVAVSETLYAGSKLVDPSVPIHVEVLLPAFVLGCIARPRNDSSSHASESPVKALHGILDRSSERFAGTVISAVFMLLVGISMPAIFDDDPQHPAPTNESLHAAAPASAVDEASTQGGSEEKRYTDTITASQPNISWAAITIHVLAITVVSNLGKMFPLFCYRKEASKRERLGLAIGMWPRGEVGAGVLVLSLSFGIGGPIVTVAMLSLALNLALTGVVIYAVRKLVFPSKEDVRQKIVGQIPRTSAGTTAP